MPRTAEEKEKAESLTLRVCGLNSNVIEEGELKRSKNVTLLSGFELFTVIQAHAPIQECRKLLNLN